MDGADDGNASTDERRTQPTAAEFAAAVLTLVALVALAYRAEEIADLARIAW